jgi:hypothetical protein
MAEADLVPMPDRPRPLPDFVRVGGIGDVRLSPNEVRMLRAATGKTMTNLLGDDADDADKLQATVWLTLRRDGYSPTWDDCGDIQISMGGADESDPTNAPSPTERPSSADSGG